MDEARYYDPCPLLSCLHSVCVTLRSVRLCVYLRTNCYCSDFSHLLTIGFLVEADRWKSTKVQANA